MMAASGGGTGAGAGGAGGGTGAGGVRCIGNRLAEPKASCRAKACTSGVCCSECFGSIQECGDYTQANCPYGEDVFGVPVAFGKCCRAGCTGRGADAFGGGGVPGDGDIEGGGGGAPPCPCPKGVWGFGWTKYGCCCGAGRLNQPKQKGVDAMDDCCCAHDDCYRENNINPVFVTLCLALPCTLRYINPLCREMMRCDYNDLCFCGQGQGPGAFRYLVGMHILFCCMHMLMHGPP